MKTLQTSIKTIANIIFVITIGLMLIAFFAARPEWETGIGNFDTTDFNEGWIMTKDGENLPITLPYSSSESNKKEIILSNTLPKDLKDGMRLCLRTSLSDVTINIDGEERLLYGSDTLEISKYYPPSAYLFLDVSASDAGKNISLIFTVKNNTAKFEEITIGYGNNAWFSIFREHSAQFVTAVILFGLGIVAILFYYLFQLKFKVNHSVLYLGQTIILFSIWLLSESRLRQIFLHVPTLTNIFSYLSMELLAVFVLLYFDEIQQFVYHKVYLVLSALCLSQLLVNCLLDVFNLVYFHNTIIFAHIWMVISVLFSSHLIIKDIRSGKFKHYRITAIGMLLFMVCTILEIVSYYIMRLKSLGILLSIGFMLLLGLTILQTLTDIYRKERESREQAERATLMTIETIAGSIDAKDEYTGGHSERVAYYASVLAENVMEEYHLGDQDLLEIHYVALMHDIGKIAVPDSILNKAGKLTDDEFILMKRHAAIGDSLLKEMNSMPELSAGVRHHHERFDGKGYPDGLKGEEIPLIARILCLADCFDAMTSNRVYRNRLSDEQVRSEIEKNAGTQFDPHLAKVFCSLLDSGEMSVQTQNGFEVNENGEILKSSLLRQMLVDNLKEGRQKIMNPSFVRMVSYIIKMAEKQGQNIYVFLIRVKGAWLKPEEVQVIQQLKEDIDGIIRPKDISIQYTKFERLIVCFDIDHDIIVRRLEDLQNRRKETVNLSYTEIKAAVEVS